MRGKASFAIVPAALVTAIAALGLAAASAASAGEPAKSPKSPRQTGLPGVQGDYHIVRPMPEPDDPDPAAAGRFRIGDMDVRIGGSITVDIGAGSLPPPRR